LNNYSINVTNRLAFQSAVLPSVRLSLLCILTL